MILLYDKFFPKNIPFIKYIISRHVINMIICIYTILYLYKFYKEEGHRYLVPTVKQ